MEIKINENKTNSLMLNKNKSTGDLIEKENIYKNYFIPDSRMEQYLSEYYNYFHSTKNSEKENSKNNTTSNPNNNTNNTINIRTNPISPTNASLHKNFNLPDDLLIEYNNRKRLDELRKKYLTNSSLRFLRKKDEIKINNYKPKEERKNNENDYNENNNSENNKDNDIKNIILELNLKYDKLQQDFNTLLKNKNKNPNVNKEKNKNKNKNVYKNHLIEENNDLKNINNNYEIIIELLISYINETNKIYLNTEKIEYFNLKQNIKNKETKCINELSDFLKKCKENLEIKENKKEIKYQKIKIKNKNNKDNRSIISKRDNKNKNKSQNKFKYSYSTISFRNKTSSPCDTMEQIKSKTLNKTTIDKSKKPRINLVKNKKKK